MSPTFLSVEQVLDLHREGIERYGGDATLRDYGLLESAVMAAQQTMFGEALNKTLEEIAASYWLSLAGNHPFMDGNKRIGLLACSVFLRMNGHILDLTNDEAEEITMQIARHEIASKDALVPFVKIRKF